MLMIFNLSAFAQTFVTSESFKRSQFRGFNLSLIENYSVLNGKNLPKVRASGANHARIWVQVTHDVYNRYYFQVPSARNSIDSAIKVAEKSNLYLILTVEFLPKQGADDWWGNATRKTNMTKFWVDSLANRYKNVKVIAAYDLMNEPRMNNRLTRYDAINMSIVSYLCSTREYVEFQYHMITAIRKVDPYHAIIVEVLRNEMLGDLSIRGDSVTFRKTLMNVKNLIYSPHGYSPITITHQGISAKSRKAYPVENGTYVANYFRNVTYWNEPAEFQKKYNAAIWVGEFACVNWAPRNSFGQWTSTRWTQDAIGYMESLGWSWCAHAWREYQGWDVEIPSIWYESNAIFTNAKPSKLPPSSARTSNAPTFALFRQYFARNVKYYLPYNL
ncbi:MAG TPA: cellulase family glycosylhydrolase [Flavitalea sp.]|nr:cellulase family glycosylhydrolase [Flavitalea sp.]